MFLKWIPCRQTLGICPDRKPKILKRGGAKTTTKEGTSHHQKRRRDIDTNKSTFPKVDFETGDHFKTSKDGLKGPKILHRRFSYAQSVVRIWK
ncbi:hypothetical protein A2U01_0060266, partial [Trifolium medium]|nr:hypothetical protein [Trifolium medium]